MTVIVVVVDRGHRGVGYHRPSLALGRLPTQSVLLVVKTVVVVVGVGRTLVVV